MIQAVLDVSDAGEAVTFATVDARLTVETHKGLLSTVVFADSSEEVFTREQAIRYLSVLESDDAKLRMEDLRLRLKQAERAGNLDEAIRLTGELTQVQRVQSRKM